MDPANTGLQGSFLNQGSGGDVIGRIDHHIVASEEIQNIAGGQIAFMRFNDAAAPLRFEGPLGGSYLWQSLLNVFIRVENLSVKVCGLDPVTVGKGQLSKTTAVEHLCEGGPDTTDADQKDRGLCPKVVECGSVANPSLAVISLEVSAFHRIPFPWLKIESSPRKLLTLAEPSRGEVGGDSFGCEGLHKGLPQFVLTPWM